MGCSPIVLGWLSAMTILTSGAIAIPCYSEITRKPDGTTDASSTKAGSILFSCRSEFFAFELKVWSAWFQDTALASAMPGKQHPLRLSLFAVALRI